MMMIQYSFFILLLITITTPPLQAAWVPTITSTSYHRLTVIRPRQLSNKKSHFLLPQSSPLVPSMKQFRPAEFSSVVCFASTSSSSKNEKDIESASSSENVTDRQSFDQAGASLIEEEDRLRLEAMGDFDSNPSYETNDIEKMRAAIRSRTASLGIEKSKVSAEYIQQKQERAMQAGSAAAANSDPDSFGGLDLSKITSTARVSTSQWDENMPTMFYDPEEELTMQEREEVDPLMKANPLEQARAELSKATWPTFGNALREVGVVLLVVAVSVVLIVFWDKAVRSVYTSLGFIPSMGDLEQYANRFEGLDLPSGWTNNMNEQDITKFTDTISQQIKP